jgi:hypothetical protein
MKINIFSIMEAMINIAVPVGLAVAAFVAIAVLKPDNRYGQFLATVIVHSALIVFLINQGQQSEIQMPSSVEHVESVRTVWIDGYPMNMSQKISGSLVTTVFRVIP